MKSPNARSSQNKYWPLLGIVAALLATAIALRLEGRLWSCACGNIQVWAGQVCSANNSQHFLDPYSFTHILHGFLFFWLIVWFLGQRAANWQVAIAIVAEACWEVFENTNYIIDRYRSETAALGYTGDTVVNSFGDIFCCLVGFIVARRLGLRRSLIVFFLVELILIVWIRDSLLLEILMLVIPLDGLRAWQMCR